MRLTGLGIARFIAFCGMVLVDFRIAAQVADSPNPARPALYPCRCGNINGCNRGNPVHHPAPNPPENHPVAGRTGPPNINALCRPYHDRYGNIASYGQA